MHILKSFVLLWGTALIIFSQSVPFKDGLLTNETKILPAEVTTCGKVAFHDMNASEAFMVARLCSGEIKIYRSENGGLFKAIVNENDLGQGQGKLLGWAMPVFGQDWWFLSEMEVRPNGFYFTLMTKQSNGGISDPGTGGSYRIISGNLEKIFVPGDGFAYTDMNKAKRTTQITFASLPFPEKEGGEFIFLKLTSNGVLSSGIFLKRGSDWSLVLPFQVTPIPGLNATYGLGIPSVPFGIMEDATGSLVFVQRWYSSQDGITKFDMMRFDPAKKELVRLHTIGEPVQGVVSPTIPPTVRTNSDTRQKYWRVSASDGDYIAEAPIPVFNPWKWVVRSANIRIRGISDSMASYLIMGGSTEYEGRSIALWDGKKLKTLVSNGDVLPGGFKVGKVGNAFTNQGSFVPVSRCTTMFATYRQDDTLSSLWKYTLPNCDKKPNVTAVVNAATFKADSIAPNSWVSIFGSNLGEKGTWDGSASTTTLGGASITVCGRPATLSFNSGETSGGWQINALVPEGASSGKCSAVVTVGGVNSPAFEVTVIPNLDLFTHEGRPVVHHADYSLVGPNSPALPGEVLMAWGTGDCSTPTATVGGMPAVVEFSGQMAPGLCQVNFVIPMVMMTTGPTCELRLAEKSYVLSVAETPSIN